MSAASPFSFHCMICFEEFDTTVNYPVVLPCGHTYVCASCANRIERCMECRTSLLAPETSNSLPPPFETINRNVSMRVRSTSSAMVSRAPVRMTRMTRTANEVGQRKLPRPAKVRLPLPKNVVLLSLMEATELAGKHAEIAQCGGSPSFEERSLAADSSSFDDSVEEEKIKLSTSIATSACGTYAVAAKDGLTIVPSRPSLPRRSAPVQLTQVESTPRWKQDMDEMITKASMSGNSPIRNRRKSLDVSNKENNDKLPPEMHLSYGDRVQVVTFVDGWATLARGYGYVHCQNSSDLVKVGGTVDKACNIEAMLHSLSLRRNQLKRENAKIDIDAVALMKEFQETLINEDDLTVICAEVFGSMSPDLDTDEIGKSTSFCSQIGSRSMGSEEVCTNDDFYPKLNKPEPSDNEANKKKSPKYSMMSIANRMLGGRLYTSGSTNSNSDEGNQIQQANSSESDFRDVRNATSLMEQTRDDVARPTVFASVSQPVPPSQAMLAGAVSWRRRNGRPAAHGIDFRTGMSGHHAIQSHKAHPHEFVDRSEFPKMSGHSGLTIPISQLYR